MTAYTISKLAKLAGVSVRTLHHYDAIDLLKPSSRTAVGYRLYEEQELLRLQQILFFKELDFSLEDIRTILDDPDFDQVLALQEHRQLLRQRQARLTQLLKTIDKTIQKLMEDDMKVTDAELYEGFTTEQIERYEREAQVKYDPQLVQESQRRVRNMSKGEWRDVKDEGEAVTLALADAMDLAADDPEVQVLIARHHAWIENFYPCKAEVYRGLGQLYAENPEFTTYYDNYRQGLAAFMQAAMTYYADTALDS